MPKLADANFSATIGAVKLWPADSPDPDTAGFVVEFPSGVRKSVAWRSRAPIMPTLEAAKEYAARLIEARSSEPGGLDDVERTNWASVVAAVQRIISDWNDTVRGRLYAEAPKPVRAH
jgi:hypothetical protein